MDALAAVNLTGSGKELGIGCDHRVRAPAESVQARRLWVGEKASCVTTASALVG
jgi:hypothetical protein